MKKFLNGLTILTTLLMGSMMMQSCDNDPLTIGDELVGAGATGSKLELDLIAYNTTTDTILSNQKVLQNAVLGVYDEPVFGKNNAKFYTQVRLTAGNPSFGTNPVVDSVILRIPVYYKSTAVDQDTIKIYTAPDSDATKKDTIWYKNIYEMDSIYGNKESTMKLNVREINTVLLFDSAYYSNANKRSFDQISVLPNVLGSVEVKKDVQQNIIKVEEATTSIHEEAVSIKIPLDKAFFTEKILNNRHNGNLSDNATFVRNVLRGLEFSVENDNGFYFQFNPNQLDLRMYYTYDNTSTADDAKPRIQGTHKFSFDNMWTSTGGYTVQFNQFDHTRGAELLNATQNPNMVEGSSKLYLNGMDGTLLNMVINQDALNDLKTKITANNWFITGAKVVLNVDESYTALAQKSPYLFAWNRYKSEGKYVDKLYSDLTRADGFQNFYPSNVHFNPMYNFDKNDGQYIFDITDHIKSILERDQVFEDQKMIVAMGNFLLNSNGMINSVENPYSNNRVSSPYRLVFHGNSSADQNKKLKLLIYYTQK